MRKLVVLVLLVPTFALAISDVKSFDLNEWRCAFSNNGIWGNSGLWRDSGYYVFGAGLWTGAILDGLDTLVTVGYNPNSSTTEFAPALNRYWREGYGNPDDRIYKYPGDWPPPLARFPMAQQRHASETPTRPATHRRAAASASTLLSESTASPGRVPKTSSFSDTTSTTSTNTRFRRRTSAL
jgi:hypothetical protein